MRYTPHWFSWGRIISQAWDQMPMNMGKLVAKEFVVDLLGLVDLGQGVGHQVHLFNQLSSFGRCELKELSGVTLKHHNRPSGEKLVFVKIGLG